MPIRNRGNIYRRLERDTDAMNDYARALELDPSDPILNLNIGVLLGNLRPPCHTLSRLPAKVMSKGLPAAQVKEMLKNGK